MQTIPWDEFDLDQEVIDVVSGSLVLWTADELGGRVDGDQARCSRYRAGRAGSWDSATVDGGFVAAVSGQIGCRNTVALRPGHR